MINQLMIQLEDMMKVERSQLEKKIITELDVSTSNSRNRIHWNAKNYVKRIHDIRKIKRNNIRILQRNCKSHINKLKRKFSSQNVEMVEHTKKNVKLTNLQLSKLKKAVKNNDGATLQIIIKKFNKDELPHELLLTTRQSTKLRNAINNNLATDVKFSKAQIKKMIQSGGFLGKLLSKLAGALMKVAIPLAKNVLAPLGLTAAMSAIDESI